MMKANDFKHGEEMPEEIPVEEHPFLDGSKENEAGMQKEFIARLKERKEWQKAPPLKEQDAANVFKEVKK